MIKIYQFVNQFIMKLYFLEKQGCKLTYAEIVYIKNVIDLVKSALNKEIQIDSAITSLKALRPTPEIQDANVARYAINVPQLDKLNKALNIDAQIESMEDVKYLGSSIIKQEFITELERFANINLDLIIQETPKLKLTEAEQEAVNAELGAV